MKELKRTDANWSREVMNDNFEDVILDYEKIEAYDVSIFAYCNEKIHQMYLAIENGNDYNEYILGCNAAYNQMILHALEKRGVNIEDFLVK